MQNSFETWIDLAPDGIVIINQKGIIVDANSVAHNLFPDCNFKNKKLHINKLIGPHKSYKKDLCLKAFDNNTTCRLQKTVFKEDHENIEIDIWVKKRIDDCFVCFIQNITEQKKDQTKLKDIVHMQSHELRAPLTNILGLVNIIDVDNNNKDINRSLLTHLKTSAKKLDLVIRKIVQKATSIHPLKKTRLVLFFRYYLPFFKFLNSTRQFLSRRAGFAINFLLKLFNYKAAD